MLRLTAFVVIVCFILGVLSLIARQRRLRQERELATCIAQRFCAWRGHNEILKFEANRVALRCVSCGYESPGWILDLPRPITMRTSVIRFRKRLSA